ncbi:MAG TPA: hypothetical protein VFB81_25050 [Myxococcales bacterium]|nr:hypothetical protein [Myxococcales bacterium]
MDNRRWKSAGRLLGALALVLCLPALATSVLGVDLDQLTRQSELVVRGVVKSKESRWSGDGRRILTDVQIEVKESLKGAPARTVTVQQPGGVVGDIGQRVDGLASFQMGEEVVVFLERWGAQRFQVTAAAQGKFRVERSSDGTRVFAVPDRSADAELLDASGRPTTSRLQTLELSELRDRVRRAAATDRTPRSVAQ